jgi:hypothetical protein
LQRNRRCSILFSEESSCDLGPKAAAAAVILDSVFGRKAAVILDRQQQRSWILFSKNGNGTIFELNLGGILSMMVVVMMMMMIMMMMVMMLWR